MLPEEAIKEFIDLYFRRYEIKISYEEASQRANRLVNLYKYVYGDQPSGYIKNNEQHGDKPQPK